ncbi:MAG: sigma-54-dependent Fis family transcriptional regulator, partial [Planctomycetota bacterium]|nr:sigma-54-dependent Fis family transcriptional regulator [Planctomycetota bacterium]
ARPPEPAARGDAYAGIVGSSPSMQELFTTLRSLEGTTVPVVIEGESGTGKELVARAIHARSPRAQGPLVAVNCGAIPEALVEAELFGHVKGSFTGAHADRAGLIEAADGGTLFLDELGELPLDAQAKLLRVLESGEVRRVGSGDVRTVDVRVVAATNRDLKRAIVEGGFREDLFYRLAVFRLRLPPLRERPQDVPRLVAHTLTTLGRPDAIVEPEAMRVLVGRRWPGNVRELKNVLERALALSGGERIDTAHVTPEEPESGGGGSGRDEDLYDIPLQDARALFSLRYAKRAIERADGSVPEAARRSGVSRQTFYRAIADGQRVLEGTPAPDAQAE